jgi:hypothetical protein
MNYVCIRCGVTWVVGESTAEPSGGLCKKCITTYVRDKQKREGVNDCFNRAIENCSETECSYWEPCNRESVGSAEKEK